MKTQIGVRSRYWWDLARFAVIFLVAPYACLGDQPTITSIHPDGTNMLVEVRVPAGFERITLESRAKFGEGTWSPLAVGQNDGSATAVTFRISCSRQTELMRVRADVRQTMPASFYKGISSFAGPVTAGAGSVSTPTGVQANGGTPVGTDTPRTVVESDIWNINGDRLYFFNQYRGLQVIDISKPDSAHVLGTLELPAAGEQMYLADSNHVLLLAHGQCGYGTDQSQLFVLNVSNGNPVTVTNLPMGGWLRDSRMVGTALYVATQNYQPVTGTSNNLWEWGTSVSSFDFADPDHPTARSTLWYPGYGNVVNANDTYLFVTTQDSTNWWQSLVQIIDITSPDGTMSAYASLRTAGRVPDKFKLNYTNAVFTTISEDWRWTTGHGPITKLETFRLPDPRSAGPAAISKLGERLVAKGLAERTESQEDKRAHSLSLTKEGRAKIPVLASLADKNDAEFFGVLTKEEHEALDRILRVLAERRELNATPVD